MRTVVAHILRPNNKHFVTQERRHFKVLRKRMLKTDTYNQKIHSNLTEAKTHCENMNRI
jgi:hypothetical protein